MVDPFFQKAQAANSPVTPAQPTPDLHAQEIQILLQQQQTLQTQYNQYTAHLQNPQITAEQKQQIQQYLQQLSLQYQQLTQQLQQLGYTATHVNKPTNIKPSSGSKLSLKTLLIGCGVAFTLLVGGLTAMLYYLIQNPTQLSSVGLDPETTKSLLKTFAVIFFALIVFLGMGLLIVNGYRAISAKNVSKTKYFIGLFVGFFVFIFGLGAGYQTLTMVKNITVGNALDNTKLILPYIQFKTNLVALSSDPKIVLLAPSAMAFKLNTDYFNGQILPSLGQASFDSMILNCGNGQSLDMNMSNAQFNGTCTYFNKGTYEMVLRISYTNTPTGEKLVKDIPAGSLVFASEISVNPVGGAIAYNDAHTEMSVGKVPSKVRFDASRVFSDLSLPNYAVIWDINGDGIMDQQNVSTFTTSYKEAKLYTVSVRFPEINDYVYSFPLRVEQSNVPVCEVLSKSLSSNNYQFNVHFLTNSTIQEYQYEILNDGKPIYTTKSKQDMLQYQLPASGIYAVKASFITDGGDQGSCESDDISVGASNYQISYSATYKSPSQPTSIDIPSSGAVSMAQDVITIAELPTILEFSLDAVQPNEAGLTKQLLFDGNPVLSTDSKHFEIKVDTASPHIATFIVKNPSSGATSEKKIQIITKRDAIVGKLLIKPDNVGTDPFVVTLDASTTTLNDPSDEIIYFTWDFGDGEIKKNLSQSIMQHTYLYNATTENGIYTPKVTVTTKKGLTDSFSTEYPITVKKKASSLVISIDSHPSQIARIGDRVDYSLALNGIPKTIVWDFGNGKTLQCSNRDCVQTTVVYDKPGKFLVKAKVVYQDRPEIEGTIAIKVQ